MLFDFAVREDRFCLNILFDLNVCIKITAFDGLIIYTPKLEKDIKVRRTISDDIRKAHVNRSNKEGWEGRSCMRAAKHTKLKRNQLEIAKKSCFLSILMNIAYF